MRIEDYTCFQVIPIWKDNSISPREKGERGMFPGEFAGDNSIISQRFGTIEGALDAMREDRTCLRESNWEIYGFKGWFGKYKITLGELYRLGYLDNKILSDSFGECYHFKSQELNLNSKVV